MPAQEPRMESIVGELSCKLANGMKRLLHARSDCARCGDKYDFVAESGAMSLALNRLPFASLPRNRESSSIVFESQA